MHGDSCLRLACAGSLSEKAVLGKRARNSSPSRGPSWAVCDDDPQTVIHKRYYQLQLLTGAADYKLPMAWTCSRVTRAAPTGRCLTQTAQLKWYNYASKIITNF
jgi:hypothetical protein